jgi:predicted ATPase/predicted Ser/Thr protein kinase
VVGGFLTEAGPPERRPASSPLRPGEQLGGYVIERELARGGMGVVYRASDPALRRAVALKVIAPALAADRVFRERFRRESRLTAQVEHPAVVTVYRAGQDRGRLFIAMRFIEGTDLATVLRERGALSPADVVALIGQIASALDAAHARGLVHRDVKPANVLLSPDSQRAFLTDFGLTIELDQGPALTRTGAWVGTLAYAAPEQLRGGAVDARTDVYALGGVLHHCLTGQVPYPVAQELDAMSAHLFDPPPRPSAADPRLPRALDDVVARAMSKDPGARFPSAGDLAQAVRAAARGEPVPQSEQSVATGAAAPAPREIRAPAAATGMVECGTSADALSVAHGRTVEVRTNLPPPTGSLIGRDRELQDLRDILGEADSRIVTVTGPGGIGKTRLALAAAHALVEQFPDGVFLVELEATPDVAAVPAAIARALALPDQRGVTPLRRVTDHARDRRLLLVLDNFEHVLDAAPELAALATQAPRVRLLVTSQAPLRVAAERVVPIEPLDMPEQREQDLEAFATTPSVELLLKRARNVDPSVALTPANAPAIGELCRRLDGLPLALELAAAQLALLDPGELLERLSAGVDALGRGARDAPSRQRGLRAALDWTTSQLTAAQRSLFAELGVFVGGFTLRLAEAMRQADILEDLAVLRDLSLVRREPGGRFSMSPPVRLYALELLRTTGGEEGARDRHARAILELALRHAEDWLGIGRACRSSTRRPRTCATRCAGAGQTTQRVTPASPARWPGTSAS